MPRETINGVSYYYETHGEGVPLVLLHGFTGSSQNWVEQIEAFAAHYRVIVVDLLGHGRTDAPTDPIRYTIEHAAYDLATLFKTLELEPLHLLGYSMGGRLALYTAAHYPHLLRSLILESASPGLESESEREKRRQSDEALAFKLDCDGCEPFVDGWEDNSLFVSQRKLPEAVRARVRAGRLANNPAGLANSLRGMGTGMQPSLWEHLGELQLPVLLAAGELDTKYTQIAHRMAGQMTDATVWIAPNAGHTIHLEQPQMYNDEILQFLTRY